MQQLETHTFYMTKDEFYYSFQEQTATEKQRAFMESGRGGNIRSPHGSLLQPQSHWLKVLN